MREPKFTDAWCFGKAFEANSKVCRVCLANLQCQKKFFKALGVTRPESNSLLATIERKVRQPIRRVQPEVLSTTAGLGADPSPSSLRAE
jgi:hypothetical protein